MTNLDIILKSRDITLPTKVHLVKAMVFPIVMYGCESWTIKKAEHRRIDAFELWCWRRLLRESLQSWVFIGRTDCWSWNSSTLATWCQGWLIWKDPDAGNDWGQEEKGMTENKFVGWHHRLNGHGFGWTLGVGDGQGGLGCCSSWGRKESDRSEWLNWNCALDFLRPCYFTTVNYLKMIVIWMN